LVIHQTDFGEDLLDLLTGRPRILKVDRVLEAHAIAVQPSMLAASSADLD
jgi:hypothetical protein